MALSTGIGGKPIGKTEHLGANVGASWVPRDKEKGHGNAVTCNFMVGDTEFEPVAISV